MVAGRLVLWAIGALLVLYLGACGLLWVFQRSLIYFPQPSALQTELLRLPTGKGDVLVSVRQHDGPNAVIYFGGNAEDISRSLPIFGQAFPDRALYLMYYPGYGGSDGSPSQEAIHRNALLLFDKVHAAHAHVTVIGRSLGSGAAMQLASERPVASLILVTPYDSVLAIASERFWMFPIRWLLKDTFDSANLAPGINVPTLLIAAEHDDVIPAASTHRLFKAFKPGVANLKVLPGTGHNTVSEPADYLRLIHAGL